ncbi:GNAT family N-acetyltransferase [Listeria sp. ILCC792]|uniref:GNAT family N-acetyltransferase n=1 Tax=Listeria sp. ILCC792 TaxID=1918331 RepID=UPI000B5973DE|nr:GNAT family N-acetyltransferase [Listeria sp. ILCC792]
MNSNQANEADYKTLLAIWRESVAATHDFVRKEDLAALEQEIPSYFPHLNILIWEDADEVIGFSATQDAHLEMLFLCPSKRGKGYGSQILKSLLDSGLKSLDVNTQNKAALSFYKKNGFRVVFESETDGQGRPYPISHLKKEPPSI